MFGEGGYESVCSRMRVCEKMCSGSVLFKDMHRSDHLHLWHQRPDNANFDEISYADDTIIVGTDSRRLNADLAELETAAELYGLRLNKKKCVLLAMYHAPDVRFKDGTKVKKVEEALYLGVQLSDSMDMTKEINMRIRSTMSTWKALGEFWKHGNVSLRKKVSSVWGCHQIKAVIWLW